MSQTAYILAGISYYVISIIIIVTVLNWLNNREKKKYQDEITTLERDKNLIISSSILSELNKVEALVNNEKLQESYEDWKLRFKEIKEVEVPKITDALIEIEDCFNEKEYKELNEKIAKAELEIFYVKTKASFLLDEIKEITLSEERNRETIIKLKSDYREIKNLDENKVFLETVNNLSLSPINELLAKIKFILDKLNKMCFNNTVTMLLCINNTY